MRADTSQVNLTRHEIEFIIRLHEEKQHNMNTFDRSKLWKVLLYAGAGIVSEKCIVDHKVKFH